MKIRLQFVSILLFLAIAEGVAGQVAQGADPAAKSPAKEESWSVSYLSGQRIGYSRSTIETVQQGDSKIVKTSLLSSMTFKRFGQALTLRQSFTTEETVDGNLLRFRQELGNPPAAPTVTSGKIEGNRLLLTKEVNGKAQTSVEEWSPNVKSSVYLDRVLKQDPLKSGETRTFEMYVPEMIKVGTVTLKAHNWEQTKLLNNVYRKLFKVTSTLNLLPGVPTDTFQDENGEVLKSSTNTLGSTMEMFVVSQAEALKSIQGAELDLAIDTLVKVKPILKGHESKKVVYRVTIPDQNPADVIPVGDSQTIKPIDKETVELTVVSLPIPPTAVISPVPPEYLESSQYLQWQDELVRKLAETAAGDATDPAEIARRMEKFVHKKLDKKNLSTAMASAAEVAKSMEGDCTEHAVLLAAMLRAKGIPSRIVVGLVYAERLFAFGGHMWTEANLNGKWIPLDATFGEGGIGAAHIKLAESSLSDKGPFAVSCFAPLMTVIGKLKLDVISSE